jgi:hypothetical protein
MVYPMDTAWLDGKIPADHYRHTRPAYYYELLRKGLAQETEENDAVSRRTATIRLLNPLF